MVNRQEPPKRTPTQEQFAGCIIGQALGDALGFVMEGYSYNATQAYVDQVLRTEKAGTIGRDPFPFGQYTDDSQLARELIQSLVSCNGFDPEDYAQRIAAIFATNAIVGRGRSTMNAANNLIKGTSWKKSGTPPPAAGNGSAMRSAPVGLFYFDDLVKLVEVAKKQSWITHQDSRSCGGAVLISGAVALALQYQPIKVDFFLATLAGLVSKVNEELAGYITKLDEWLNLDILTARKTISGLGMRAEEPYAPWQDHGLTPFVIPTTIWSLYSFLRNPDDYFETICTCIAVGGDVDTTAAMSGAISGAYLGLEAIPKHLAEEVHDLDTPWNFEGLTSLVHNLYDLKVQK